MAIIIYIPPGISYNELTRFVGLEAYNLIDDTSEKLEEIKLELAKQVDLVIPLDYDEEEEFIEYIETLAFCKNTVKLIKPRCRLPTY